MSGQDLFYALSFVDECYIHEADTAGTGRAIPWKKVLSVAACLCILCIGLFTLQNYGAMRAPECALPPAAAEPESAVMDSIQEAAPEAAPPAPESAVEEDPLAGDLVDIAHAKLRVVKVLEDGNFEAVVEADEPMEMDTQVMVVVDPSKVPAAEEIIFDAIGVVEDALFEIYDGAYDPERNILYVAGLLPVDE